MKFKSLVKKEEGQALAFVAILFIVLLGFAGLAIDGGRLYMAKAQLQKAVDAGVLAGGDIMLKKKVETGGFNHDVAKAEALKITEENYKGDSIFYDTCFRSGSESECNSGSADDNVIRVNGEEKVSLVLMPIVGFSKSMTLKASAEVQVGTVNTANAGNIIPIGISKEESQALQFGTVWDITDSPGEGFKGNYNFLDFSSVDSGGVNGATGVSHYIENGSPVPISINQEIATENGEMVGQVKTAIEARVGDIVYVPIISEIIDNKVTVLGFAAMKIIAYDTSSKTVKAEFIEEILDGDIGAIGNDYGTYTSKLIL